MRGVLLLDCTVVVGLVLVNLQRQECFAHASSASCSLCGRNICPIQSFDGPDEKEENRDDREETKRSKMRQKNEKKTKWKHGPEKSGQHVMYLPMLAIHENMCLNILTQVRLKNDMFTYLQLICFLNYLYFSANHYGTPSSRGCGRSGGRGTSCVSRV